MHTQPIRYDLDGLARVVAQVQPDLLGIEIERDDFERGNLARAPIQVREVLISLARRSDIVLVPIGESSPDELRAPSRSINVAYIRMFDATLATLQKAANDARRVNSAIVNHACGLICHLEELTCGTRGRNAWKETNERMLTNIVEMVKRDPGTRILVAVQCRRKHWLEPKWCQLADVELVNYWEL